jgi:transposase
MSYEILIQQGFWMHLSKEAISNPLCFTTSPEEPIARWVIERSNAWMERCKILVKNFERTLDNAKTKIDLCFVRLMLKRLAASH